MQPSVDIVAPCALGVLGTARSWIFWALQAVPAEALSPQYLMLETELAKLTAER